jgi:hypothetical protein
VGGEIGQLRRATGGRQEVSNYLKEGRGGGGKPRRGGGIPGGEIQAKKKGRVKTRKRGWGEWDGLLQECFLMPAKQRNINKIEISGQKGGKLTHGTHIHASNVIFGPREGGMRGRGREVGAHGG